ncbi:TetR family transcriptional regulator [Sulfobacillus acidophilus TPY]|uniref:Transcriptional regulator, TetR family n=1 Tax=Sulfobacillus acidophilus (strain ATCC 700253 / DSM 10332 / NAL) TaxID=679936 RepID=G8TSQ0_SULAD|nr:TetR family transcriptional regulator [Sulfobacillus acidophilus TPY]AEW04427.1 transcriptional regulator, TetR family [Sulfobacillus acidophilus DSM 10332]
MKTGAEKTRDLILAAALKEFAESGFDRTTMDAIAVRAGVAKGSIYYHFPSKDELWGALFHSRAGRLAELTRAVTGDDGADLVGVLRAWVDYFWAERDFLELLLSEAWRNQEREALVAELLYRVIEPVLPLLGGDSKGELWGYALFGAIAVPALHAMKSNSPQTMLDPLIERLAPLFAR